MLYKHLFILYKHSKKEVFIMPLIYRWRNQEIQRHLPSVGPENTPDLTLRPVFLIPTSCSSMAFHPCSLRSHQLFRQSHLTDMMSQSVHMGLLSSSDYMGTCFVDCLAIIILLIITRLTIPSTSPVAKQMYANSFLYILGFSFLLRIFRHFFRSYPEV